MSDVKIVKGTQRSILYAKTARARLYFDLDFGDYVRTPDGDLYVIRNNDILADLIAHFKERGFQIEDMG